MGNTIMKWIGITGSWRKTSGEVEKDVRAEVRDIDKAHAQGKPVRIKKYAIE